MGFNLKQMIEDLDSILKQPSIASCIEARDLLEYYKKYATDCGVI